MVVGLVGIGTAWYLYNQADDTLTQLSTDAKNELIEAGTPIIQEIGAGIGQIGQGIGELGSDLGTGLLGLGSSLAEEIGEIGSDLGTGALKVIRGAGVAVIEGAEDIVDYAWTKIAPHRVPAVTAVTAITIYLTTAVILFKKIRNAN
tara:strand:- start:11 stop:451 length:441 start_codon:yes stop_codon:yes gene_type:complete